MGGFSLVIIEVNLNAERYQDEILPQSGTKLYPSRWQGLLPQSEVYQRLPLKSGNGEDGMACLQFWPQPCWTLGSAGHDVRDQHTRKDTHIEWTSSGCSCTQITNSRRITYQCPTEQLQLLFQQPTLEAQKKQRSVFCPLGLNSEWTASMFCSSASLQVRTD